MCLPQTTAPPISSSIHPMQAMIAPVVIDMTFGFAQKIPFKDGGLFVF